MQPVQIRSCRPEDAAALRRVVQAAVNRSFPAAYAQPVVELFLDLESPEHIADDCSRAFGVVAESGAGEVVGCGFLAGHEMRHPRRPDAKTERLRPLSNMEEAFHLRPLTILQFRGGGHGKEKMG